MSELVFEWDEQKAAQNKLKHGISFIVAKTVFNDPFSITVADAKHSVTVPRWIDIGLAINGELLVVWYTERDGRIRLIGCRSATRTERRMYEDEYR